MNPCTITEDTIDKMRASKRKRASKTVNRATNLSVTVEPFFNADNQIQFHVSSEIDKKKTYTVEYKVYGTGTTKPRLVCNCGHQFGRDDRDHCKHIAAVILYQLTQFSFATNDITSVSSPPLTACDETTLINMFKNLGSKAMGTTEYFQPAKFKFSKTSSKKPSPSPSSLHSPSSFPPPPSILPTAAAAIGVSLSPGENPFNIGPPATLATGSPSERTEDEDMNDAVEESQSKSFAKRSSKRIQKRT